MATAQLNARVEVELKREGDATLARYGASATDAIRSLWGYMATTQTLPPFMCEAEEAHPAARDSRVSDGAGLAVRMASARGLAQPAAQQTYADLRRAAFEEMIEEGRFVA